MTAPQPDTEAALAYADDLHGNGPRQILGIFKDPQGRDKYKPKILAWSFDAADRDGQREQIIAWQKEGRDGYIAINPLKAPINKKANKNNVNESRNVWVDLDPLK